MATELKEKKDALVEGYKALEIIENATERIEQETKPEKIETVNVTLTVPLSVAFHKMLLGLSEITGVSVENMLTDDLFSTLTNYFSGDYFNGWVEWAVEQKGQGITVDDTKNLEKQMETIRETLY